MIQNYIKRYIINILLLIVYIIQTADVAYMPQSAVYKIQVGHVSLRWRGSYWIPKRDPIDITFNMDGIYVKISQKILLKLRIINADVAYVKSALVQHYFICTRVICTTRAYVYM